MRVRSFTTVAIRLMGLMSIFYGVLMLIYMLIMMSMFSGMAGGGFSEMGSVLWMQFLLPGMMIVFGIILIAASRSLGNVISGGLEE